MRIRGCTSFSLFLLLLCLGRGALAQPGPYFDPERWSEAVAAFAAQDAEAMPPEGAILFVGSSSIRFWHDRLAADMAPLMVIGRGFGGSTMQDAVYLLDRLVLPYRPRAVVLYEGDNDIGAYGVSAEQVRDLFQLFAAMLHRQLPETRLYVLAVKPSVLRQDDWPEMQKANALLAEAAAADERIVFVDVATPMLNADGTANGELLVEDDLHMNAQGYDIWAEVVRPVLMEREAEFE